VKLGRRPSQVHPPDEPARRQPHSGGRLNEIGERRRPRIRRAELHAYMTGFNSELGHRNPSDLGSARSACRPARARMVSSTRRAPFGPTLTIDLKTIEAVADCGTEYGLAGAVSTGSTLPHDAFVAL